MQPKRRLQSRRVGSRAGVEAGVEAREGSRLTSQRVA